MNSQKLVSVIIPTFMRPEFLNCAVNSVIGQSYKNIEVVVVDDNTLGAEIAAVKDICSKNIKIIYVKNFRSKGACGARNSGIISSKGDYIAFLDDDDVWLPNKIERQIDLFSRSECDANYSGVVIKSKTMGDRVFCGDGGELFVGDVLSGDCPLSSSLLVAKRSCIIDAGLFDESLPSFQDYDLVLRILKSGRIFNVKEALAEFTEHSGERVSVNISKRMTALDLLEKKWGNEIQKYCKIKNFRKKFIVEAFIANARSNFGENYWRSLKYAIKALLVDLSSLKAVKWVFLSAMGAKIGKNISVMYRKKF